MPSKLIRGSHGALTILMLASLIPADSFFLQKAPTVATSRLLTDLDSLIAESRNGVDSSSLEEVKLLMTSISAGRGGDQRLKLPGKWELVYTTEKEINFFRTSWPFAKVSSITQQIDPYNTYTVENSILFEGGGEFAVTGSVAPAESDGDYDRVAFEFQTAIARVWGRDIELPPVGAGWFDTMFCDEKYRLSQDNRGDWSVFKRL